MMILADIWPYNNNCHPWATKESIVNAAKRVGVSSSGLSINFMQQDKFARAEACIDPESSDSEPSASSSITTTPILSPDKPKGCAGHWKDNFDQAV